MSNRAPLGSLPGGVFGGNQTQKSRQLADVFDLAPVPNAGQKLAGHDPADPGKCFQMLDTLRQFRVGLAKAADLSGRLKDLLLVKLQTVEQPIELKAHGGRTGKFPKFLFDQERPLATGRSRGNSSPSMSSSDLMRCFIRTISMTKVSRSWVRWRSSRYKGVGT